MKYSSQNGFAEYRKNEAKIMNIEQAWWQKTPIIISLTLILSAMDAMTLYTVFDTVMVESQFIGIMYTFGIALLLNFIPLILGKLLKDYFYKRNGTKLWSVIVLSVVFMVLFTIVFWLRFETRELNFSGFESSMTSTVNGTISDSQADINDTVSISLACLLGISPLITSIVNLYLGYMSTDPLKQEIAQRKDYALMLAERQGYLIACKKELESFSIENLEILEEGCKDSYLKKIKADEERLKILARLKLAEALKNAGEITTVTDTAINIVYGKGEHKDEKKNN